MRKIRHKASANITLLYYYTPSKVGKSRPLSKFISMRTALTVGKARSVIIDAVFIVMYQETIEKYGRDFT